MTETKTRVYQTAIQNIKSSTYWKKYLYKKGLPKRIKIAEHQLNQQFIYDIQDSSLNLALSGIIAEMINRIHKDEENKQK